MVDYTSSMRLRKPQIGADDGQWATYTNNDWDAVDVGVNGILVKSIAGLTAYTLVADGSTGDEARYQSFQFTGALSGDCTVTVPSATRWGRVRNVTSGGKNVILSTGAGTTLTVPPSGYWYIFQVSGAGVGGWADQTGAFSLATNPAYYVQPGGLMEQWGTATGTSNTVNIAFSPAFSANPNLSINWVSASGFSATGINSITTNGAVVTIQSAGPGISVVWRATGAA